MLTGVGVEARVFRLMHAQNLARGVSMPERMDEGLQLSHFIALTRPCVHAGSTHGPLVAERVTPHVPELLMLMLGQILQLCRNLSPAGAAGRSSFSLIRSNSMHIVQQGCSYSGMLGNGRDCAPNRSPMHVCAVMHVGPLLTFVAHSPFCELVLHDGFAKKCFIQLGCHCLLYRSIVRACSQG